MLVLEVVGVALSSAGVDAVRGADVESRMLMSLRKKLKTMKGKWLDKLLNKRGFNLI